MAVEAAFIPVGLHRSVGLSRSEMILDKLRGSSGDGSPWLSGSTCRPQVHATATETRGFLQRSVRFVADEGVRHYLVVGPGEPAHRLPREVIYRVDPWAHVTVTGGADTTTRVRHTCGPASWAQALRSLYRCPTGDEIITTWLESDATSHAGPGDCDLSQPLAVVLLGVLHHVVDYGKARALLSMLSDTLPPGSFVIVSHLTRNLASSGLDSIVRAYQRVRVPVRPRSRSEMEGLLSELDLVAPGIDLTSTWRRPPAEAAAAPAQDIAYWGAVGRVTGGRGRAQRDEESKPVTRLG